MLASLHDGYDMKAHTRADSSQAALLDDDFVDRFAIAGPPDYCLERLGRLASLGIEKVAISGPTAGTDPVEARRAMALLRTTKLPIAEVAAEAGFGSPQAFSRTFRQETGQAPRAYRGG